MERTIQLLKHDATVQLDCPIKPEKSWQLIANQI